MRGKLRSAAAAVAVGVVGLGGAGVALVAAATPAFAAGTFVSPAVTPTDNPSFTIPANGRGNPIPPDVVTTNFPQATNIFLEVCDGRSPSAQGYDVTLDCDNTTAPTPIQSQGLSFQEMFTTANHNEAVLPFRGIGGGGGFNCLAPEDVKGGTTPNPDGSVTPIGSSAKNGNPIDPAQPSWTNCKVRVSSNNASNTNDQSFITFALSNGGTPLQTATITSVAETPPTSATAGTPVTLSTTLTGTSGHPAPSGTVTFDSSPGTAIGGSCTNVPVPANGTVTCTTSSIPAGNYSITGVYTGDAVYNPVTSGFSAYHINPLPPPATPEVPLAVILPLGAAGLFAGGFLINRRRRSNNAAA